MSIEKHKAFLDSLEPEKELPEEMYGLRFDASTAELRRKVLFGYRNQIFAFIDYLAERCRRAESRQIPDLKEKVKAFGLACMDAENARFDGIDGLILRGEFRELCAPEVKP